MKHDDQNYISYILFLPSCLSKARLHQYVCFINFCQERAFYTIFCLICLSKSSSYEDGLLFSVLVWQLFATLLLLLGFSPSFASTNWLYAAESFC